MTGADVTCLIEARRLCASGDAKALRIAAGVSLSEVGGATGVHLTTVWKWENGQRSPRGRSGVRYGKLLRRLAESHATSGPAVA